MDSRFIVILACTVVLSGCMSMGEETPDSTEPGINDSLNQSSESDLVNETSSEGPDSEVTTVTYTGSGFDPGTVTVEQGDTVRWVSEASRSMWVGSDEHPTHRNYAGSSRSEHCQNGDENEAAFDQCSSGKTYSFTFEQAGEWGYHNHLYAAHTGTVIVE